MGTALIVGMLATTIVAGVIQDAGSDPVETSGDPAVANSRDDMPVRPWILPPCRFVGGLPIDICPVAIERRGLR